MQIFLDSTMNVPTSKVEILIALVASPIVCPDRDAHSLSFLRPFPIPNYPLNFL